MKFQKIKLKRCKDCAYYKRIGNYHFCINSKCYRKYKLELLCPIPLICFRKEKKCQEK